MPSSSSNRAVARRRRLGERTAQEERRRLGGAVPGRRVRGLEQPFDDPGRPRGLARQQMLGDAFRVPPVARRAAVRRVGGPARAPRPRGPRRSRLRTIGWMKVSGRPDRGSLLSRAARLPRLPRPRRDRRDARPGAGRSAPGSRALVRAVRRARVAARGGGGASGRSSARRSARRPAPPRRRGDPALAQRVHELAQQERRPACRAQAGVDEGRIGQRASLDSTTWATAVPVSGSSRITSADGSAVTSRAVRASVPVSRGRAATTSATSSSSSRVSRNAR